MMDRLDGLRHDAIIRRHDQYNQIGNLCAAGAHRREGLMTGRVEKGHHPALGFDVICADVLRDPSRFPACHPSPPYVIQERGLAMVDVTHNGNNRRTRFCFNLRSRRLGIRQKCLGTIQGRIFGDMTQLLHHDHRGFLIQHLIDGYHIPHLHQSLDHFGRLYRHLLRQRADGDGLGHHYLMHDRLRRRGKTMSDPAPPRHALPCLSLRVRQPLPPDKSPWVLSPRFSTRSSFQTTCLVCFFFLSAFAALSSGLTTGLCKVPSVVAACG